MLYTTSRNKVRNMNNDFDKYISKLISKFLRLREYDIYEEFEDPAYHSLDIDMYTNNETILREFDNHFKETFSTEIDYNEYLPKEID